MAAANQIDILGLGAVAVDDVICVEGYPPADVKAQVIGRQRRFGGLTGIALVTAARLGARCAYAGTLGRDELSCFALESLKREKIDVSRVKRTASACGSLSRNGSRITHVGHARSKEILVKSNKAVVGRVGLQRWLMWCVALMVVSSLASAQAKPNLTGSWTGSFASQSPPTGSGDSGPISVSFTQSALQPPCHCGQYRSADSPGSSASSRR